MLHNHPRPSYSSYPTTSNMVPWGGGGIDGIPGEEGVELEGDFVESTVAKGATVGGGV